MVGFVMDANPDFTQALARVASDEIRGLLVRLWQAVRWHPTACRHLMEIWDGSLDHLLSEEERFDASLQLAEADLGSTWMLQRLSDDFDALCPMEGPRSAPTLEDDLARLERRVTSERRWQLTKELYELAGQHPDCWKALWALGEEVFWELLSPRDRMLLRLAVIEQHLGPSEHVEDLRRQIRGAFSGAPRVRSSPQSAPNQEPE
jgi:hypothetical protein